MSQWPQVGKWVVALGGLLVVFGLLLWLGDKVPFLGRLPGDLHIKGRHFRLFFPLTTCVLLSVLLTILLNLFSRK